MLKLNSMFMSNVFEDFWVEYDKLQQYVGFKALMAFVYSVLVYFLGKIIIFIIFAILKGRAVKGGKDDKKAKIATRKILAVEKLVKSVWLFIAIIFTIVAILTAFDIDTATIMASAGFLGLIFGFAAQALLRDVIAGWFLILENHLAIGDFVSLNSPTGRPILGRITEIGIRSTVIKSWTNEMHVLPNSTLTHVENYSTTDNLALLEFKIDVETDLNVFTSKLEEYFPTIKKGNEKILSDLEFAGITNLDGGYNIRVTCSTQPEHKWPVERYIFVQLVKFCSENNFSLARGRMDMHNY